MLDFFFKVVNLAVLAFLLYKFVKTPLTKAVKERHEALKRALEEATEAKRLWEAKYREYDERMKRVEEEARRLREELLAEAKRERDRILREAEEAAARIRAQAEVALEQEMRALQRQLRERMADLTVEVAERIIRDSITPEDQKRLLQDYVANLRRPQ